MSGASGSRKLSMEEIMQKWDSLKSDWNNNVPMCDLMQKWDQIKVDWERIRPQFIADESFQHRINLERSCQGYPSSFDKVVHQFHCFKFPIWDDYAKLQNHLKSLPSLMDRVIVEQSELGPEFNKLKTDLIGLL